MNRKMVRGIIVLIAIVGIAGVFLLIGRNTDTGPKKVFNAPSDEVMDKVRGDLAARKAQDAVKPPPPGETHETGHWDGDHWHKRAPEVPSTTFNHGLADEFGGIPHRRGFTSTNPLFVDGVPEHLQCPKEIVGVYDREIEDLSEVHRVTHPIIVEILTKYNPERPLTEVWLAYIEAERFYYANADPEQASLGEARGRLDWQFQNLLDFPEITVLQRTDSPRSKFLRQVFIGHWPSNWNQHKLDDGRIFYAGNDYKYDAIFEETYLNSEGLPITNRFKSGFGHAPTSEQIEIKLAETTDEELEELGGWNYNVDPYATRLYTLPPNATAQVVEKLRSAIGGSK